MAAKEQHAWEQWELDLIEQITESHTEISNRVDTRQIRQGIAALTGRRVNAIAQAQAALKHAWSDDDDQTIKDGLAEGVTVRKIAGELGVSPTHVAIRALQLGL